MFCNTIFQQNKAEKINSFDQKDPNSKYFFLINKENILSDR